MGNKVANNERRVANRANVSWMFRGYNKKQSVSGVITNVSSSGCLANISCKVEEGESLTLRITAQTDNGIKDIVVTTIVQRVILKGGLCFVGIRFSDLSKANKRFISGFVDAFLKQLQEGDEIFLV